MSNKESDKQIKRRWARWMLQGPFDLRLSSALSTIAFATIAISASALWLIGLGVVGSVAFACLFAYALRHHLGDLDELDDRGKDAGD